MIIKYNFADGTSSEVDVSDEIGSIIIKTRREEENLLRKERYHCLSIDGFLYEGAELTTGETIETFLKKEHDIRDKTVFLFTNTASRSLKRFIIFISTNKINLDRIAP